MCQFLGKTRKGGVPRVLGLLSFTQKIFKKATLRYFYEQIVAGGMPICKIKILVANLERKVNI